MELNILRDDAYNTACEHGFHDKELSNEHCLCLVISELMEVVEADRKGNYAYQKISSTSRYTSFPTAENRFKKEFNAFIKDTVEDELADAVIRLLDLAGSRDVNITVISPQYAADMSKMTFTEAVYSIAGELHYREKAYPINEMIGKAIGKIISVADAYDIDLLWHIEQKMKYNKLREKMHGKKY